MVDFQDPIVQLRSGQATLDILFAFFGAYLFEVINSFDFDLLYIRRKKRFTLAAAVYFITRYLLLICYILGIYMTNLWEENPDCVTIVHLFMLSAYATTAMASGLLILRVRALSERNILVTVFLLLLYCSDWALMIWQIVKTKGFFLPAAHACLTTGVQSYQINTVMAFILDMSCLAFMLFYTLRGRDARMRGEGMWSLMRNQGLLYMFVITGVYVCAVAIAFVNLNAAVTQAVNIVGLFTLVVCATRLHRKLILYNDIMLSRSGATFSGSVSAPKFATARTTVGGLGGTQTSHTLGVGVEVDVRVDDDASDAFPMSKLDRSPSGTSVAEDDRKRRHDSMV